MNIHATRRTNRVICRAPGEGDDVKHIRVSDAERDRACVIPREHFAVGRLKKDELDNRVNALAGTARP
ncbi:DUF1707 domain-containing protein [Streptosporangium sp. NPDC001681]|uniref:DUF1707 SHOCT-like domain-containing protein n=1 Tax=Streptosporangium sp. NPDC001681 TaxID=3154395 RepID=UPI00332533A3